MNRLAIFASALALAGCSWFSKDLTDSTEVAGAGWTKGATYKTSKPTFLLYSKEDNRYWLARSNADHLKPFIGHQCGPFVLPRSLEQYQATPDKWPGIVAVLPTGTDVQFQQAYFHGGIDSGVGALSMTGRIAKPQPVQLSLQCISIADPKKDLWHRDTSWLTE